MKIILHGTEAGLKRLQAMGPDALSKALGMKVTRIEKVKVWNERAAKEQTMNMYEKGLENG